MGAFRLGFPERGNPLDRLSVAAVRRDRQGREGLSDLGVVTDRPAEVAGELDEHVARFLPTILDELEALKVSEAGRPSVLAAVALLEASTHRLIAELRQPATAQNSSTLYEGMTQREIEILTLLGQGMTNKQIGSRLLISERTVRNHISNLYSKLKVADRVQAALYGVRKGLILP